MHDLHHSDVRPSLRRPTRLQLLVAFLVVSVVIPTVALGATSPDPCVFGDVDMRTIFPPEEWEGIDSVGIAFFPVPGMSDQPVASFEVLLMDNDSE